MIEFFAASYNFPFLVSFLLFLGFSFLEIFSFLMGMGLSGILDDFLPDLHLHLPDVHSPDVHLPDFHAPEVDLPDLPDVDLPVLPDADGFSAMDSAVSHATDSLGAGLKFLQWIYFGKVPALVYLIFYLLCFCFTGYLIQGIAFSYAAPLPSLLAGPISFFLSFFPVRFIVKVIGPFLPREETMALSDKSFEGLSAKITVGTARKGSPAEAKLLDKYGKTHYLMVEPMGEENFLTGEEVVLVQKDGAKFMAVKMDSE